MRQLRNFNGRNVNQGRDGDQKEKIVHEAMEKYGDLDEDSLITKLHEKVEENKRNGTFNPGEILEFASKISPLLDERQREKLAALLHTMGCE